MLPSQQILPKTPSLNCQSPSFSLGLHRVTSGRDARSSTDHLRQTLNLPQDVIAEKFDERDSLTGDHAEQASMETLKRISDAEKSAGIIIDAKDFDMTAFQQATATPNLSGRQFSQAAFPTAVPAMIAAGLKESKELNRREMLAAAGMAGLTVTGGGSVEAADKNVPSRVRSSSPMPRKISWEWHGLEDVDRDRLSPTERMMYELTLTYPAFQNAKTETLVRQHKTMYREKRMPEWKSLVAKLDGEKLRKTFLGEYFSLSGEAVCTPIDGIGPEPNRGKEHPGVHIYAYTPSRTKNGTPFSEKFTAYSYVMGRGHIPAVDNPYKLYFCMALKNFNPAQVRQIVEGMQARY